MRVYGRVSLGRIEGDVELETSGGALDANRIEGSVRARTSGGRIEIDPTFETRGPVERNKVNAEPNDGGDELNLRTSGGWICSHSR